MQSSKVSNQIDLNDAQYVTERMGLVMSSSPCPQDKFTGKINPHVSRFKVLGGKKDQVVSVFHVKPVYYEHKDSTDDAMVFRPMYEVCEHYGNHLVVFKYEELLNVHPRFIDWLKKRMKLINGQILVTSPFSPTPSPWSFVHETVHASIVRPKIGLTTTTVYPDPDPETTTCDGIAWEETSTSSWSTMMSAGGDSGGSTGGLGALRLFAYWADGSNYRQNARSFTLFDTSSITDTDTIDSATLSIKVYDKTDPASKTPNANIYTATPASNTNIVAGDYAQTGSTAQCDTAVTYASMTANVYADWALNTAGKGNVSKTGVSKFACKNANYDAANSAPGLTSADAYCRATGADETGTTSDPKLVVVHSAGSVSVTVSAGVNAGTFSIPTYTPKTAVTLSQSTLTALFSIPTYSIFSGVALVLVNVVSTTFSVPTYVAKAGANVAVNTLTATFSAITYAIGLGSRIVQATLSATFTTVVLSRAGSAWTKISRNASGLWTRSSRNND